MNDDKKNAKQSDDTNEKSQTQETLPELNPFKPGEDKPLTQEDLENEKKYHEAITERD